MIQRILIALPFAVVWVLITAQVSLESFLIGWVVSFGIVELAFPRLRPRTLKELRFFGRGIAAFIYLVTLFWDVFVSSLVVARRIIDPKLPLKPGIIAVSVGREDGEAHETLDDVIAAFSAHRITITPGELVVDFDGNSTIYVHCLDVDASAATAVEDQARREAQLRRIFA